MNNLIGYLKTAYQELMFKVTWPSWADLQSSAIVVLAASIIIAIFIWIMDFISKNGMMVIYDFLMNLG
jgi:preprotein translocase subunit SecE